MLKLAKPYKDQIEKAQIHVIENEEQYKYLNVSSYWDNFMSEIPDSDWNSIIRLSVAEDKVLGYFKALIARDTNDVSSLTIVNFNLKTISFTFIKDLETFIKYLLEYKKFRKIAFSVVVGNPAERLYDKFIEKYNGRVVGVRKNDVKLVDGKYYDLKLYELENALTI